MLDTTFNHSRDCSCEDNETEQEDCNENECFCVFTSDYYTSVFHVPAPASGTPIGLFTDEAGVNVQPTEGVYLDMALTYNYLRVMMNDECGVW